MRELRRLRARWLLHRRYRSSPPNPLSRALYLRLPIELHSHTCHWAGGQISRSPSALCARVPVDRVRDVMPRRASSRATSYCLQLQSPAATSQQSVLLPCRCMTLRQGSGWFASPAQLFQVTSTPGMELLQAVSLRASALLCYRRLPVPTLLARSRSLLPFSVASSAALPLLLKPPAFLLRTN